MRLFAAALAAVSLAASAQAEQQGSTPRTVVPPDVQAIAPALGAYTDGVLFGDAWRRAELAPRDRSIVTVAALVAGGHTRQMPSHLNRALDNGVKPSEIIGLVTHLAFYAGWPNAMSAVGVAKDVFAQRGVGPEQLAPEASAALPVEGASEALRAANVEEQVGDVAPALARYTNGVLFGDLGGARTLHPVIGAW